MSADLAMLSYLHVSAPGAAAAMSTTNIKALIQALPQFRDILSKLSMHIFISSELKAVLNARSLTDLGGLEQDLVYGDKNSQDLIKYLAGKCRHILSTKQRYFELVACDCNHIASC